MLNAKMKVIEIETLDSLHVAVMLKCEIHRLEELYKDLESGFLDGYSTYSEMEDVRFRIEQLERLAKVFYI